MRDNPTEACGRCSMSTVVEAVSESDRTVESEDTAGSAGASARRSPFDGERIEIEEAQLRRLSPAAWASRLTSRLDNLARRLTYGR